MRYKCYYMNDFIKILRVIGLVLFITMSMGMGMAMAVPMPSMKKKEDTIEVVDQSESQRQEKTFVELDASMLQ